MQASSKAKISAVEYYLPSRRLDNQTLEQEIQGYSAQKILAKTGIRTRAISAPNECASDLAVCAAQKLFDSKHISPNDVDFLLLCTQSPDYFLPTTACLVHEQLNLPKACGCFDYNLGCSGYVYGLGIAKGIIETHQAKNVLLITSETYSKFIHNKDRSVRSLFGDAAAATLVSSSYTERDLIGPFIFGSDGSGAKNLIVPTGGLRKPYNATALECSDSSGNVRTENNLFMNGPEIFNFTLRTIPKLVDDLLNRAQLKKADISYWIFHQANKFMLDHLCKKIDLPTDKVPVCIEDFGNTVSSTIPITLTECSKRGMFKEGDNLALLGFGVGYSWGGCVVRW